MDSDYEVRGVGLCIQGLSLRGFGANGAERQAELVQESGSIDVDTEERVPSPTLTTCNPTTCS